MQWMTLLVSCNASAGTNSVIWPKKSCWTSFQWYQSWCHQCHVMLFPKVSFGQKSDVLSQFDFLDLRNPMVPVMTPLAPCDTNASSSDITWTQKVILHLISIILMIVQFMVPSSLCDANTGVNGVTWWKITMLHLISIVLT